LANKRQAVTKGELAMCQDREKDSLDKFLEHPYYYGDVQVGDGIAPDKRDIPMFELTPKVKGKNNYCEPLDFEPEL
jgi:hypothetical protein